jgi:deoxyxylulose-5-phosphate synthase
VGVVNARFVKPLDRVVACKAIEEAAFVLTVEEGCLSGGFGSAVLEAASDAGLPAGHVRRLGLPDRFVLHAEREEQLAAFLERHPHLRPFSGAPTSALVELAVATYYIVTRFQNVTELHLR